MLSVLQLGLIPPSETRSVALVQAAFVFPPIALSSVLASLPRDARGPIMALISASWLANGLIDLTTTPPTSTNATRGLLALAAILLLVGAIFGKPLHGSVIALGLEDLHGKPVLPIGRHRSARRAFEGDLGEQVGPIKSEACVRKQL